MVNHCMFVLDSISVVITNADTQGMEKLATYVCATELDVIYKLNGQNKKFEYSNI